VRLVDDITCVELVDRVTDYLEGALPPEVVERFEEHLVLCDGCSVHVEQMLDTIRVTSSLGEQDLQMDVADRLLATFRGWREATSA
jgi:anti-sigma factor RsiW